MHILFVHDFNKDFVNFCRSELASNNYDVDSVSENELRMAFWKYYYRIPLRISRAILRADGFVCPSKVEHGLALLEQRVKRGESLQPNLSTRTRFITEDRAIDDLLSDWNIHHFHLGENRHNEIVDRTDLLLFATLTDTCFYEIAIMPHGNWCDKNLLEIIDYNWPELLSRFILPGVSMAQENDAEFYGILRRAHVQAPIALNSGKVLSPPGVAYATDGTPCVVIENHDKMVRLLHNLESKIENGDIDILHQIPNRKSCSKIAVNLSFSLDNIFRPKMQAQLL